MRTRILPVLILAMGALLGAFVFAFYHIHEARLSETRHVTTERAQALVQGEMGDYVALMTSTIAGITRDENLRTGLENRDRAALLAHAEPLFQELNQQFHINHFYFHTPDRINLLRVHEPSRAGDLIERATLAEAVRTGKVSSGIEQGPTGNCTLRVVYPWVYEGKLLGYVELGTEFESVAQRVHEMINVDLLVAMKKELLNRERWEERNLRLGRTPNWEQFPSVVVVDKTTAEIPEPVAQDLAKGELQPHDVVRDADGKSIHIAYLPLQDMTGKNIGMLVVVRDISDVMAQGRRSVIFVTVACVVVGSVLVLFFYVFLGRIERDLLARTHELADINAHLELRVEERTTELETTHRKLVSTARQAGMAEIATGVLHNVGNVLNSVNVSAALVNKRLRASRVADLTRATDLLQEHGTDLGTFVTQDERGRQLPGFMAKVAKHLATEQQTLLTELDGLTKNVAHIKQIVEMQQAYAGQSSLTEPVNLAQLVEDALRINAVTVRHHEIHIERHFDADTMAVTDKHKVLQILINLLTNAVRAMNISNTVEKKLVLRVTANAQDANRLTVSVSDSGVGIAPENLTRIFAHGFTTWAGGHGFGLHSAVLAARDLQGTLLAQSAGVGTGATFVLELPRVMVKTKKTSVEAAS